MKFKIKKMLQLKKNKSWQQIIRNNQLGNLFKIGSGDKIVSTFLAENKELELDGRYSFNMKQAFSGAAYFHSNYLCYFSGSFKHLSL